MDAKEFAFGAAVVIVAILAAVLIEKYVPFFAPSATGSSGSGF